MSNGFELDHRLANDCEFLYDLALSRVLMMNDSNYPWFILVPRIDGVFELTDLSTCQQQRLLIESNLLSQFIQTTFKAEKLNVAALGNVVKQLHIHHIGRFESDIAWPKPVWNQHPAKPYAADQKNMIKQQLITFIQSRSEI